MNLNMKLMSGSLALLLAAPSAAFAAGFGIYEHSAKGTGKVSAMTATVEDPSAIFYNPAGLTGVKGAEVQVGLTLIRPTATYTGAGLPSTLPAGQSSVEQSTQASFVPVPNFYYGNQISEKAYVGVAFYAPYGLGINWGDDTDFVGRTVVQELSLRTFFISPAIALKLNENFSAGFSVSIVPATVYLNRVLGAQDNGQVLFPGATGQEGNIELSGSGLGVGASIGVQARLIDNLRLGLVYRTSTRIEFSGDADFTLPENTPTAIQASFPDGPVNARVTLPHSFALGIGWVDGPLSVELTTNLTLWESYDELRVNFEQGLPSATTASPRRWTNTPTFRLGGEYSFGEYVARAGVGYDVTPVPDDTIDPTLPDSDRILFSLGGGAMFGPVSLDLAYMGVFLQEREANGSVNFAPGVYKAGLQHLISATVGFRMD